MQTGKSPAGWWVGWLIGAASLAAPVGALAGAAADQFYERSLMGAADTRCGLFSPSLALALNAARVQARGAALRSGTTIEAVSLLEQNAWRRAESAACGSRDLSLAASRVRKAFEGYAQLQRMDYPGDTASWTADRASSATIPFWRLSQAASAGPDRMIFGLAARGDNALAVASFADGAAPYAARLVLRDPARTAGPYLDTRLVHGGRAPLSARIAPRSASLVFNAQTRDPAPPTLLPTGAKTGLSFRFPGAAVEALARLDPREAITVEFVFAGRGGDSVRRAHLEVGDFAAGRAFLGYAIR